MKTLWIGLFMFACLTWLVLFGNLLLYKPSSEIECLSKNIAHDRVKACLASRRPAGECLQEAWALCLKDLAEHNGR